MDAILNQDFDLGVFVSKESEGKKLTFFQSFSVAYYSELVVMTA